MNLKVYVLRCFRVDLEAMLTTPGIVGRPKKPMIETRLFGGGGRRVGTGMAQIRVVLDRAPPPDTATCTWRCVGSTTNPKLPTYTAEERCKRNHAPLRYLSNGGCVQCAKEAAEPEKALRLTVQMPVDVEFDDAVKSMGWKATWQTVRHNRRVVVIDVGVARKSEAIGVLQAFGWEPRV